MTDSMSHNVSVVDKKTELDQFLTMVEDNKIPDTWEMVAQAIGVHPNTISNWKKLPQFKEAKAKGVEHALKMMQVAGEKDWKMWREKLNLLGAATPEPTNQINITVIPILGGNSNAVPGNLGNPQDIIVEEADTGS